MDPTTELLDIKDVIKMTVLSERTIYRKLKDKSFPPPVRPTKKRTLWRKSDVLKWIEGLTS